MALDLTGLLQLVRFTAFFKSSILVALGAFLIFLFIVYKQVHSLNQTVRQTVSGSFLEFLSIVLIFAVVVLFFIAIAIL